MRVRVLLAFLPLLLASGEGKRDQEKIKVHVSYLSAVFFVSMGFLMQNCSSDESSPFSGVLPSRLSYVIVAKNSSCMHYAWSVEGNLTLFLAYTTGRGSCNCNSSTFNSTRFPGDDSITLPGSESHFSLGVVFTKLVEFNATKHKLAAKGLYLPVACNKEMIKANHSYSQFFFNETTNWTFVAENSTLIGMWNNASDTNHTTKYKDRTRFSIRVRYSCRCSPEINLLTNSYLLGICSCWLREGRNPHIFGAAKGCLEPSRRGHLHSWLSIYMACKLFAYCCRSRFHIMLVLAG